MEDNIPQLIVRYRVIKAQSDAVKLALSDLKAEIEPLIKAAGGKWKDKDGYARFAVYKPSVSFETKAVNNLALSWIKSADPIMRSCGEMLLTYRRERSGYTSFQIK